MAVAGTYIPPEVNPNDLHTPLWVHGFPYHAHSNESRQSVHDLHYAHTTRMPFIILRSRKELSEKQAYEKLSISLSLLALFEEKGFKARAVSGIGGYYANVIDEIYVENIHVESVEKIILILQGQNNPFQIQSRFTLSRAYALSEDPESSIIEHFKIIELFIKYVAFSDVFSDNVKALVLNPQYPKLFSADLKSQLQSRANLSQNTINIIWKMKAVRNRLVGHGGIRPALARVLDDPEDYETLISEDFLNYDPYLKYDENFFEKIMYDISVLSRLLFCKMNELPPSFLAIPGCWWEPSNKIKEVIAEENMEILPIDYELLNPVE